MKNVFLACLVATSTSLFLGGALAQATDAQKQAAAEKWKQMTPEEQAAAKSKAKSKWESMTPEEQAAAKKRYAEKHPQAAKRMEAKASAPAPAPASAPAK
jgi:Protein of unknown function (DUF3106)